jgi:hypothetical protein
MCRSQNALATESIGRTNVLGHKLSGQNVYSRCIKYVRRQNVSGKHPERTSQYQGRGGQKESHES